MSLQQVHSKEDTPQEKLSDTNIDDFYLRLKTAYGLVRESLLLIALLLGIPTSEMTAH